jgi:hypothetical protein
LTIVSDKGAIVLGNPNLATILVAEYRSMDGTYEACRVRVKEMN